MGAAGQSAATSSSVPQPVGIKLGEGRLHPFLDVDTRYDSIVFGGPRPAGDLILHFRPGLRFDLTNDSTLVAFNGSGEYLWYTQLLSGAGGSLSRFQANVGLDAHFNKDGPVEVQIGDTLLRTDRTHNPAADIGIQSLYNEVRLAVPIHPGGRALEITPKVSWQIELFDPLLPGTGNPSQANYSNVNFGLNNRWKFLPKTAIVLDAAFDWRTYASAGVNRPASVLRVQAGLVGLVSPRISVTLLAGYSGDFAFLPVMSHNFIANAELAYIPSDLARVAVGYLRTTQPVPVYGIFGDDRGYLSGRLGLFGGRLNLLGQVSADYFTFGSPIVRSDLLLSATAGPSFDIASWFQVGASYTLGLRAAAVNPYVRHEAILRLTVRY